MSSEAFSVLHAQVLWAAFTLSLLFGVVLSKTHFCTMGALSDMVTMGDLTRLRQWVMALGVAMIGYAVLVFYGQMDANKTLYASPRWTWLSAVFGGGLFGFGMVLASGCGSKTLVRLGSGNLKSLVVFLVMGISAFATLKGITAVVRVATVDKIAIEVVPSAALPSVLSAGLGWSPQTSALGLGLLLGLLLLTWAVRGQGFLTFNNLLAGSVVGAVVIAMWWVSGHLGHVAEHPQTLEEVYIATNSGRAEAFSFVAPIAYVLDWLMFFSDQSKVLTIGVVSVPGVVLGAFFYAKVSGTFRWEGFRGTEDLANHLLGGMLMGVGGITAMGCTIGQGLSGLSTLSLTSGVAVLGIVLGALPAFKYQIWRMERSS